MLTRHVTFTALMAFASGQALSATCEEIVASVAARIRANGVSDFTVAAVDLAASAPGRQVGTCDVGRKKIMYLRGPSASEKPPPSPAQGASRPSILTECADGRVVWDGNCKK